MTHLLWKDLLSFPGFSSIYFKIDNVTSGLSKNLNHKIKNQGLKINSICKHRVTVIWKVNCQITFFDVDVTFFCLQMLFLVPAVSVPSHINSANVFCMPKPHLTWHQPKRLQVSNDDTRLLSPCSIVT